MPAGAVEPLVAAMADALAADTSELERMGRAGALRVAERHNVDHEGKKLADLIAAVVQSQSAGAPVSPQSLSVPAMAAR